MKRMMNMPTPPPMTRVPIAAQPAAARGISNIVASSIAFSLKVEGVDAIAVPQRLSAVHFAHHDIDAADDRRDVGQQDVAAEDGVTARLTKLGRGS